MNTETFFPPYRGPTSLLSTPRTLCYLFSSHSKFVAAMRTVPFARARSPRKFVTQTAISWLARAARGLSPYAPSILRAFCPRSASAKGSLSRRANLEVDLQLSAYFPRNSRRGYYARSILIPYLWSWIRDFSMNPLTIRALWVKERWDCHRCLRPEIFVIVRGLRCIAIVYGSFIAKSRTVISSEISKRIYDYLTFPFYQVCNIKIFYSDLQNFVALNTGVLKKIKKHIRL